MPVHSFASRLRQQSGGAAVLPLPKRSKPGPLWEGPESPGPNGGITQSMLGRFLVCRERFRLSYVEGFRETDRWQHKSGYGDMWHVCEEALAADVRNEPYKSKTARPLPWVEPPELTEFVKKQCRDYPMQQQEIVHWYNVCKVQFPVYVDYWRKHPDVVERVPIFQEQVFDAPYKLPSGRVVRLRGKWDSVDQIGKTDRAGVWLQENKTKGDVNEEQLKRQLTFDLQTMFYLVALETCRDKQLDPKWKRFMGPLLGVRYNVVRRPLSGGRGTIKKSEGTEARRCTNCGGTGRLKTKACSKCVSGMIAGKPPETDEHFYARLRDDYIAREPESYFMRWQVQVTAQDIQRFKDEFLTPCLEQLCDWWDTIGASIGRHCSPFELHLNKAHYRMPYGVYSPLLDGGSTDLDEHLLTGSEVGLRRVDKLFKELQ